MSTVVALLRRSFVAVTIYAHIARVNSRGIYVWPFKMRDGFDSRCGINDLQLLDPGQGVVVAWYIVYDTHELGNLVWGQGFVLSFR